MIAPGRDVLMRHRLPARLGKPFGSSTGLTGVRVDRRAGDLAVCPREDEAIEGVDTRLSRTAGGTAALADDGEDDPVAEVGDLLDRVLSLLVRSQPIFKEAA